MNKTISFVAVLYFIQILLAFLNPYNFYSITLKSVVIYIAFIVLLICYSQFYKSPKPRNIPYSFKPYIVRFVNFYLFLSVLFFGGHLYLRYTLNLTSQELRNIFYFGEGTGELTIFNYLFIPMSIVNGFAFFLFLIFLVDLREKNPGKIKLFLKTLAGIILVNSAESGRMSFFILIVCMILFYIKYKGIWNYFRENRKFTQIFIISFLIFLYITFSRLEGSSFCKFLYIYFIGPVFLFDYSLNDLGSIVYNSEERFGFSFMSLDWLLVGVYNVFTSGGVRSLLSISDRFLTYGFSLNQELVVNAFFTNFTYFYIDFGFLAPLFIIFYHYLFAGIGLYFFKRNILALDIFLSFFLVVGLLFNALNSPMYFVTLFSLYFINPYSY